MVTNASGLDDLANEGRNSQLPLTRGASLPRKKQRQSCRRILPRDLKLEARLHGPQEGLQRSSGTFRNIPERSGAPLIPGQPLKSEEVPDLGKVFPSLAPGSNLVISDSASSSTY